MFLPIKRLALSASLIGLLFCLTACQKKETPQKPDANEKVLGYVEKRTIETTVGKEFGIEVNQPVVRGTWHLLTSGNPQDDPVRLVRIEAAKDDPYKGLEGHLRRERWVFKATEPGEHTILMALVWESWQYGGYLEVRVLVKP